MIRKIVFLFALAVVLPGSALAQWKPPSMLPNWEYPRTPAQQEYSNPPAQQESSGVPARSISSSPPIQQENSSTPERQEHPIILLQQRNTIIRDSIASFNFDAGGEKISGILHGPAVTYTYHDVHYPLMARGEFEILFGYMDYEANGDSNDSDEIIINTRGLLGYDILYHDNLVLTPYLGLAMRYWHNNVSGARDQNQRFFYIPLGVETKSALKPTVDFGTRLETEFIVDGSVTTDFDGDQGRTGEAVNDLDFGYGLRASVYITKQFEAVGIGFEPFVRYWNVEGSDGDWVRHDDGSFEDFSTQRGETFIWGASLTVNF